MTTTKPNLPAVPTWYRNLVADYKWALKTRDHAVIVDTRMALSPLHGGWTAEQSAEIDAYNAQVRVYNNWVDAQRRAKKARVQAAQVQAERKATQAATCSSCFTIHAGECY